MVVRRFRGPGRADLEAGGGNQEAGEFKTKHDRHTNRGGTYIETSNKAPESILLVLPGS